MFDKLVESSREKRQSRTSRIFFLTGLIYMMLMCVIAVTTILGLNPSLAESYSAIELIPPPPLLSEALPRPVDAPMHRAPATPAVQASSVVPREPVEIASLDTILKYRERIPLTPGKACVACKGTPGGLPDGIVTDALAAPEPPPPARPKATPEPAPMPTPKKDVLKVSSISPGMALRRVTPQYSAMARAVRAAGAVPVQVVISEEGRVISAEAVGGHPMLRPLAVEAARQWLFKPTILNEVPVKVQGVLTFNFTLN